MLCVYYYYYYYCYYYYYYYWLLESFHFVFGESRLKYYQLLPITVIFNSPWDFSHVPPEVCTMLQNLVVLQNHFDNWKMQSRQSVVDDICRQELSFPFYSHCEPKAMRDEAAVCVAGHPLLNRRCARLPGCICLWNDLHCVGWGVELYSLIHPMQSSIRSRQDWPNIEFEYNDIVP